MPKKFDDGSSAAGNEFLVVVKSNDLRSEEARDAVHPSFVRRVRDYCLEYCLHRVHHYHSGFVYLGTKRFKSLYPTIHGSNLRPAPEGASLKYDAQRTQTSLA